MTAGHIFYIPISLLVGLILGYYWGRQAEEKASARHNERAQEGEGPRRRRRRRQDEGEG